MAVSRITLMVLLASLSAHARQELVPGSRYTSARAAAMGDAFIPLADEPGSALFYNPAGLARIAKPQFEPANFQFYGNTTSVNTLGREFYKAPSLSGYLPVLQKNTGQLVGMGSSVFPNFGLRGFGFGVLVNAQVMGSANVDGTVYHRSLYQIVPAVGFGVRLASGIVRLGYSLQWVNQASGDEFLPGDQELRYTNGLQQGSGFSHTFGFALTLPFRMLPAFNLVARNVLGTRFNQPSFYGMANNPDGSPPDEAASYDASVSVQPKAGKGSYFNFVLQYRDMTNTSGMSVLGRAAAGLEFSLQDQLYLRGGWGSGYPSAGLGLRRKGAQFSLTWYSEEIGSGYHTLRDTRFLMHYQIGVF
jgi:hypothetical protein